MKKGIVIGFIFGIIVCSTFSAIAGSYKAKDVTYTPNDSTWNVSNVSSALDNIKQTDKTEIANLQSAISNKDNIISELQNRDVEFTNIDSIMSGGNGQSNRTVSKELTSGTYIVTYAYSMPGVYTQQSFDNEWSVSPSCSDSSLCQITKLYSRDKTVTASQKYNDYYLQTILKHSLYKIKVTNTTTVSFTNVYGNTAIVPEILSMQIAKISE